MSKVKMINGFEHILHEHTPIDSSEMLEKSSGFYQFLESRRSVREFSSEPIPKQVIDALIQAASTAPSGAHKQPWTFCAITNPILKKQIREAAETEERESYSNRMSDRWLKDLGPLATDEHKPFIEDAPWIIVVFKRVHETDETGVKNTNYYVNESVGIACGFLISAIHNAGLATLTHTPSPMNFLAKLLNRPENERAFLLLPVGYPKENTFVPRLHRKDLSEVSVYFE